jgi:hypothetical protein
MLRCATGYEIRCAYGTVSEQHQVCPMNVSLEVDAPAGAASGNHLAVRRRRCFVAVQTFTADTSAVCRTVEPGAPGPSHLVVRRGN